jgi:phage host-nuclease inhibitor protein Gam
MAPTKLADTRTMTLDDARATFADLARAEIELAKLDAATEARIAQVKANHEERAAVFRLARDAHAYRLTQFILANPEQFRKPRAICTDFGRFGRRTVANVEVFDWEALQDWALENGHMDTVRTTRAPVKPAIAKRIKSGQDVPGCKVVEGEEAFYAVDKALATAEPAQQPQEAA